MSSDPETSQSTTHEAGTIPGNHPIKPTPIAGRVSRAKKGVPHTCEVCRPPKVFTLHLLFALVLSKHTLTWVYLSSP